MPFDDKIKSFFYNNLFNNYSSKTIIRCERKKITLTIINYYLKIWKKKSEATHKTKFVLT